MDADKWSNTPLTWPLAPMVARVIHFRDNDGGPPVGTARRRGLSRLFLMCPDQGRKACLTSLPRPGHIRLLTTFGVSDTALSRDVR